jgi:dihydrolipoamide dehydrogenase
MQNSFDLVTIGGGPGGYVCAIRARQLGLNVAIVEREKVGGVCLNRGCIPTKALLSDVQGIHWTHRATKDGIIDRPVNVDFSALMRRKTSVVDGIVSNLEKHLCALNITIIHGKGQIKDPETIQTDLGETIKSKNIVLATGSRPWRPPIPGIDSPGIIGTREALELTELPKRLAIIGGGVVGQEFAAIFASFGSRVTVLEVLDQILVGVDKELAKKYASFLPGKGVAAELGAKIHVIEKKDSGLRITYEKKGKEKVIEVDLILVATGRRPWVQSCGAEELGIVSEHHSISVDPHLQTSVKGVYAIGDVLGRQMLAHLASYHGEVAAENIAGRQRIAEDDLVPSCVFTIPQMAWVGLTAEQAESSNIPSKTSTFTLWSSGKAVAMGEPKGWMKLIENSESGRLIGAHFMGPDVSELIGMMTLAISSGMSAADFSESIFPHPTISEAVREAALGLMDGPIHSAPRVRSLGKRNT